MIDTGVLVGEFHVADPKHKRARELIDEIVRGSRGHAFVTDYIVAETLNYAVAKHRDRHFPERVAKSLLGEDEAPWVEMRRIDEVVWRLAREKFRIWSRAGLSFTDCTSLAAVEAMGLEAIVSFDSGFDGIVARIH